MEAYEYVRHLDHAGRIANSPSDKKQKAATALLRDAIQKRDFSWPIATRASKILGPISRHFMAQIIPMICNAARATRPGLAVGILRVLCNCMCTAQRFHIDDEEQQCGVGCLDEPDSLSRTTMNVPFLYNFVIAAWRNPAVRLRRDRLFHDLITQTLLRPSSMELWLWVLSTPLFAPTIITAVIWIIQGISETAWKGEFGI